MDIKPELETGVRTGKVMTLSKVIEHIVSESKLSLFQVEGLYEEEGEQSTWNKPNSTEVCQIPPKSKLITN